MMIMIAAVPLDESTALSATNGSGTESDPYSGTVTGDWYDTDFPIEIYVEVGTTFDVSLTSLPTTESFFVDEGFGLEIDRTSSDYMLRGTVNNTGTCLVETDRGLADMGLYDYLTIHIVQSYPELVFDSDPVSDSTITYYRT